MNSAFVCGGRGKHSRHTPQELVVIGERVGVDGTALAKASRLVAKVDSAAVQDGFDLYLHGFIVTDDGNWTVVQQGMNGARKQARRYHWLSEGLKSFVDDPHAAIDGKGQGEIVNLADRRAEASRCAQLDLLSSLGPDKIAREYSALETRREQQAKPSTDQPLLPHLIMPAHHDVRGSDMIARRLHGNLAAAADRGPKDFPDLLLTPGVGARTVRALAMVAEVMHGAPCRFTDPARFSVAHGGKDRHPFPVPLKVYDETIKVLKSAVQKAKLGRDEELGALRRLDEQSRKLERHANGPTVANLIAEELDRSHSYGGRSVFGWEPPPADSSDRVGVAGPRMAPVHCADPPGRSERGQNYDQRTEQRFDIKPERLAGDTAYGSGANLNWLVNEVKIAPHIPVVDKSKREDGTFSREDFTFDKERNVYICPASKVLTTTGKVATDAGSKSVLSIKGERSAAVESDNPMPGGGW
jgi:uncharacterized protein